jgi:hypothetical protein
VTSPGDLPPLDPVEQWLDFRDVLVRLPVAVYERWSAAAARDGYGQNLAGWLRDLADRQAATDRPCAAIQPIGGAR